MNCLEVSKGRKAFDIFAKDFDKDDLDYLCCDGASNDENTWWVVNDEFVEVDTRDTSKTRKGVGMTFGIVPRCYVSLMSVYEKDNRFYVNSERILT
jgi:hypothetical protein